MNEKKESPEFNQFLDVLDDYLVQIRAELATLCVITDALAPRIPIDINQAPPTASIPTNFVEELHMRLDQVRDIKNDIKYYVRVLEPLYEQRKNK